MLLVALVRTLRFDTTSVGHVLVPARAWTANRTGTWSGNCQGLESLGRFAEHWPHDFGNHVAGLAHHHCVTWAHIFELHLFSVVQRGHATRCFRPPPRARSTANGVARPVRPIDTLMSRNRVVRSSGGNLTAIAQRGALEVDPSRSR